MQTEMSVNDHFLRPLQHVTAGHHVAGISGAAATYLPHRFTPFATIPP